MQYSEYEIIYLYCDNVALIHFWQSFQLNSNTADFIFYLNLRSSTSLLVLYTSSTLYHSFFALMITRYVFEVLDKCAIYILIAGSYTPYLQICLHDKPKWSIYLLAFIWFCAIAGVSVEACFPAWKYKPTFSLSMYLGMGWACVVCLPDLIEVVPQVTLHLLILGGVAYTGGVPFFVRNNNLDHR